MKFKHLNKKGQFFIAAGVIIIFSVSMIFHYIVNVPEVESSAVEAYDFGLFFNNLREEYGEVVEYTLVGVSNSRSPTGDKILYDNLTLFSDFLEDTIVPGLGMYINVTAMNLSASNTSMNASVNLTLITLNGNIHADFIVRRSIDVYNIIAQDFDGVNCIFEFNVSKEYGEPIPDLVQSDLDRLNFNGTSGWEWALCNSMVELSAGRYSANCSTGAAGNDCTLNPYYIEINLTDQRGIFVTYNQSV